MHIACFDQHWSSSGGPSIADETAVLPSVSTIFAICPRLRAHVSCGDGWFLLLWVVWLLRMLHARRLVTNKQKVSDVQEDATIRCYKVI
jgi:hypothetical protein